MSLMGTFNPHRTGRHYWDVWDYPQHLQNQNFGLDMNDSNWTALHPHSRCPHVANRLVQKSGLSEVVNDSKQFKVSLDCSHFTPEEISVKTVDHYIVISGNHEEKKDNHGWVSRTFTRKYALPVGCETHEVTSHLNSQGVLNIQCPKKALEPPKDNERVVAVKVIKD